MCGIAGIILKPDKVLVDLDLRLEAMARCMAHRGPDDQGVYVSPNGRLGFANRRLAIRDLSPAGHMPMVNASGNVVITYNGEIYNTEELRHELEQQDYKFISNSDTEVILHGYEAWGKEIVRRLRGMFAFAILDQRGGDDQTCLLIARDHLGIKPIYYSQSKQALVFGSEVQAVLASGLVDKEISSAGLVGYLSLGSMPNPHTLYHHIESLPPASYLIYSNGKIFLERYWEPSITQFESISEAEAVRQVTDSLAEAVRVRLVSDVPLGAFLSGGVDSSAIAILMRQATTGSIRTCSIAFEEQDYNEASFAREIAQQIGSDHYEKIVTADDVLVQFERILDAMDQPTVDGVNTYFVSQTAREAGLTVALSGLGGDELFGGYPSTFGSVPRLYQALRALRYVPGKNILSRMGSAYLPPRWSKLAGAIGRPASLSSAYLVRRGLFSLYESSSLLGNDSGLIFEDSFDDTAYVTLLANDKREVVHDHFNWISKVELLTYTHNTLLRDTDAMSMAHSLEVRVPFLDKHLVEMVLRLPTRMKTNGNMPKPLLVKAMGGMLPPLVWERKDKMGFVFPFEHWLRTTLKGRMEAILFDEGAGLFNQMAVSNIWRGFLDGRVHWSRPWAVAVLKAYLNH